MIISAKLYILLPLIFAFLLGISQFIKNTTFIRRIAKTFFIVEFIISTILLLCTNGLDFQIFDINFVVDKYALYFSNLISLIYLLLSFFSKGFIFKLHRLFYSTMALLFAIVNLILCCDNIFVVLLSIFWILLIDYMINTAFVKKENKDLIKKQFLCNLLWFFVSLFLITKDFIRYFVINNIAFDFSKLSDNLYHITDDVTLVAFIGFLILIGLLFKLVPFSSKNLTLSSKANSFVYSISSINSLVIGGLLFSKIYLQFDYLFFQIQEPLAIFLLLNLVIFVLLLFKQDRLFKYLSIITSINIITAIFAVFSFESECYSIFSYYLYALVCGYIFCACSFMILKDKFKTDLIDDFKKINDNTKLIQLFSSLPLLNFASVPLLSLFSAKLLCVMMIFSSEYESLFMNTVPYCILIALLIMALSVFNIIYRIFIEPCEKSYNQMRLLNYQVVVMTLFLFLIFILSFAGNYFLNQFDTVIEVGNF